VQEGECGRYYPLLAQNRGINQHEFRILHRAKEASAIRSAPAPAGSSSAEALVLVVVLAISSCRKMKSGKRKRDDRSDAENSSSSSEDGRVEVKRRTKSWSEEENIMLKRLKEKGLSWAQIAKSFPQRTLCSCQVKYA
jgi:hypothetical protein